jgi:hypothetical protein
MKGLYVYNTIPSKPVGGGIAATTLAYTGFAAQQFIWWAIAAVVVGGTLIGLSKLRKHRIALEPVKNAKGRYRLRLTRDGRPITRKAKK